MEKSSSRTPWGWPEIITAVWLVNNFLTNPLWCRPSLSCGIFGTASGEINYSSSRDLWMSCHPCSILVQRGANFPVGRFAKKKRRRIVYAFAFSGNIWACGVMIAFFSCFIIYRVRKPYFVASSPILRLIQTWLALLSVVCNSLKNRLANIIVKSYYEMSFSFNPSIYTTICYSTHQDCHWKPAFGFNDREFHSEVRKML